jgi:hypothetical protein
MTSVNVSSVTNTITVTADAGTTVVTVPQTSVVTATTVGPQGASADISALEARVAALEALNIMLLEG